MDEISPTQFYVVTASLIAGAGAMALAAAWLAWTATRVSPRYRPTALLCCAFCAIAGCSYAWLYVVWGRAFAVAGGAVVALGGAYDNIYRYPDWLLTVPLQLVAFVLVLETPPRRTGVRALLMSLMALDMIGFGFLAHATANLTERWMWFCLAMVPFLFILGHLYRGMGVDIDEEPPGSRHLVQAARLMLVLCWPVYATIFVLQTLGFRGPAAFVGTEAAYAVADIGAKIVFAVLICRAALAKSRGMPDVAASAADMGLPHHAAPAPGA